MSAKRTKEQQLQVGKEWNEAKAKGVKIEDFCAEAGRPGAISVANYERVYRKTLVGTPNPTPKPPAASTLEAQIEAAVAEQMKAARIKAWTDKIKELEAQLDAAKAKLLELQPEPVSDAATDPANQN
jgi:hypothetical protein